MIYKKLCRYLVQGWQRKARSGMTRCAAGLVAIAPPRWFVHRHVCIGVRHKKTI